MAQGFIAKAIITVIVFAFFLVLNELVFRALYREREKAHFLFFQRFIRVFLIVVTGMLLIAEYSGLNQLAEILVGSIAIISGIAGFAAQSVLRDFFAGLMISIYQPFDVGDRLLLDQVDKPSVVEEITMRHTVLKTMDGIRYIIPNSEIGSTVITNTSYRQKLRGSFITVSIEYDENVEKAIHAMREAVRECPYTLPNNPDNSDLHGYGDVYLMGFENSALRLETVIWTEPETDNFLACSEVRSAIIRKFRQYDIEIPYQYINIIEKDEKHREYAKDAAINSDFKLKKRNTRIKTDPVEIRTLEEDLSKALEKADKFAAYYTLTEKEHNMLRLLSEELIGFTREVTGDAGGKFWIAGNRNKVQICLKKKSYMSAEIRQQFLELSSTGKNAAVTTFADSIREMIESRSASTDRQTITYREYKKNNAGIDEDLEKKIISSLSDDIKVGIRGNSIEISVMKNFHKGKEEAQHVS